MFERIKERLTYLFTALALLNLSAFSGFLMSEIEEVVVTARKKTESLQDVPLSVAALRESSLEEKGISVFEDYLLQLPTVTAGGNGPGTSTIYIRGLASTTPNLTTAGVAGLAPNVSFYLDEQPLAQPGRNLDVYAADMARIEVLGGPQGTLFGASSQAGVVRMITNKPVIGESSGNVEVEARVSPEGDPGAKVELVGNFPLGDSTAARVVAYRDTKGGYIDQVAGLRDVSASGRFRAAGTVRQNGLPVSASREGFQAGADLSGVTMLNAGAIMKDDANELTYQGFRASVALEINESWDALATVAQQTIEADGVFFVDPNLGDLEIQRFSNDEIEDEYDNMSLTLEGSVGDLEIVYAGAYTDRTTEQVVDYTDYLFVGQYLPYYICDGSVTYPGASDPSGTCQAPDLYVDSTTNLEVTSHEFRINADINDTTSLTAGVFMSDTEVTELNFFTYPGSQYNLGFGTAANGWTPILGWAPNYPHTNPQAGTTGGNTGAGWYSVPGPYTAPVIFWNDIKRTDEQRGVFGEVSFATSDTTELSIGARWYDIAVDFEGSANSSFYNFNGTTESTCCGSNLSTMYAPGNANGYPDKAETDGVIGKVTYSWKPSEDSMYYVTWSEGFRPGLLNRPAGRSNPAGTYTVPADIESDEITNIELGWKNVSRDGRLRFNGSIFRVDVSGLQSTIFDPSVVNLFFSDNAADAEIKGVEGDFIYYTEGGLILSGAFSMMDTEITKSLIPTGDIVVGQELAFAPGYQANLSGRKEWTMEGGNTGFWQVQFSMSDKSYSDIMQPNRAQQDSYNLTNIRAGIDNDEWIAELYVDNVTDERAETSNTFVFDRQRVAVIRPMTVGLRYKLKF